MLGDVGNYYFEDNSLDKAFQYYTRSREAQMTMPDNQCTISYLSYHLGMVTYRQERFNEAANYFKQSNIEATHCIQDSNNYFRQQEILNNVGLSYYNLNLIDSASVYFKKAMWLIDTEGVKYNYSGHHKFLTEIAKGVALADMAKIYLARGQNDSAEYCLKGSIAINEKPGYLNDDAMSATMQLGELYFKSGQYDKVPAALSNIRVLMDSMPDAGVDLRWRKLMYEYSLYSGNKDTTIKWLIGYHRLKDSIDVSKNALKKTDYAGVFKEKEAQFRIAMLKKDNEVNRLSLFITIGFTFIAVIITVFIYYNYKRSRQNVKMLTSLNTKINEQKIHLEEAMVQLQHNNEDKDKILHIVAHDLRTPINGVMMLSDYLLEDESDEDKKDSLNMIVSAAKNLQHLTQELLEFSGNARPPSAQEREQVELNGLGRHVVTLLQFKANEKKQTILFNPAAEPLEMLVHKEKINRVLGNLITNAIKFSKEGSQINVSIARQEKKACITVKDSGIGIPEKMLPTVFDTFTNAKRHGTAGERSYGLGLSICKQIIEGHNGRIWVESIEGEGSTFFIELPL